MIDSLPNVWMIDGLLVTSWSSLLKLLVIHFYFYLGAERQEVANFFEESARSSRPTVGLGQITKLRI